MDAALAEIIEKEKVANLERNKNGSAIAKKNDSDRASAEGARLKAMASLGQKQKRNADSDGREITPRKRRRKTSKIMEYLKEKNCQESILRKEEMDLKKEEHEHRIAQQQTMEDQHKQVQEQ